MEWKFATKRDPSRPTRGTRQGQFARVWLGGELMPAQQYIADVAGELVRDEETGLMLPARSLVVVTEPRRAGKSHLAMAMRGERCFSVPNHRSWYTAQTGGDARDAFLKFGEQIVDAPLGKVVRTLVGNGREVMKFPNLSTIRPHPPTEQALHGKECDDNDVDEAWAFSEEEGKALMQAIAPTQLTRPGAQTWIWSAGGTAESTWLAALVARGRAGDPSIAYFEAGIPDDADAEDLDVIAAHHPAYGHTVTMQSLRSLRTQFGDDAAGWARAAGNRWTEVIGGAIGAATWATVRYTDPIPAGVPVGYGAARAEDGSHVAIAAAANIDGVVVVELVDVIPAHDAGKAVKAWAGGNDLVVDPSGPSAALVDDLVKARTPRLVQLGARDSSAACAKFLDALPHRAYRFRPSEALDEAVKVAAKRRVGDGGYAWSRSTAGASIAPLEAATNAAWAITHRRAGKPAIYFQGDAA